MSLYPIVEYFHPSVNTIVSCTSVARSKYKSVWSTIIKHSINDLRVNSSDGYDVRLSVCFDSHNTKTVNFMKHFRREEYFDHLVKSWGWRLRPVGHSDTQSVRAHTIRKMMSRRTKSERIIHQWSKFSRCISFIYSFYIQQDSSSELLKRQICR